ncbi:hypothetical protein VTN00DRAFT_4367 [Thermoascus crustaceus]|uniref:uncharacterized protein n=1 Tax=Thermoascus crustaceus TaxID=5088 RepID=UPI00374363E0
MGDLLYKKFRFGVHCEARRLRKVKVEASGKVGLTIFWYTGSRSFLQSSLPYPKGTAWAVGREGFGGAESWSTNAVPFPVCCILRWVTFPLHSLPLSFPFLSFPFFVCSLLTGYGSMLPREKGEKNDLKRRKRANDRAEMMEREYMAGWDPMGNQGPDGGSLTFEILSYLVLI